MKVKYEYNTMFLFYSLLVNNINQYISNFSLNISEIFADFAKKMSSFAWKADSSARGGLGKGAVETKVTNRDVQSVFRSNLSAAKPC